MRSEKISLGIATLVRKHLGKGGKKKMTSDMEKLIITSDMTIEVAMHSIETGSYKTVFIKGWKYC